MDSDNILRQAIVYWKGDLSFTIESAAKDSDGRTTMWYIKELDIHQETMAQVIEAIESNCVS